MASFDGIGLLSAAILAVVRTAFATATFATTPAATLARVTVYDGVAEQTPTYPFVVVGGADIAQPFNTLGDADQPKFGSIPKIVVRLVTQYPTTRAQASTIWAAVKAALDGKRIAVSGFGDALVTCETELVLPPGMVNGPVIMERLGEFEAELHQTAVL
jgi:hypothetical protein